MPRTIQVPGFYIHLQQSPPRLRASAQIIILAAPIVPSTLLLHLQTATRTSQAPAQLPEEKSTKLTCTCISLSFRSVPSERLADSMVHCESFQGVQLDLNAVVATMAWLARSHCAAESFAMNPFKTTGVAVAVPPKGTPAAFHSRPRKQESMQPLVSTLEAQWRKPFMGFGVYS